MFPYPPQFDALGMPIRVNRKKQDKPRAHPPKFTTPVAVSRQRIWTFSSTVTACTAWIRYRQTWDGQEKFNSSVLARHLSSPSPIAIFLGMLLPPVSCLSCFSAILWGTNWEAEHALQEDASPCSRAAFLAHLAHPHSHPPTTTPHPPLWPLVPLRGKGWDPRCLEESSHKEISRGRIAGS